MSKSKNKLNALILAAGFGTRMGSLSKKTAKPLLPVAGTPIVEHLATALLKSDRVGNVTIVTNRYYFAQFETWAAGFGSQDVDILSDGTVSNEKRRGATADLRFAVDKSRLKGPLIVLSGDNLYTFPFEDLITYFEKVQTDVVAAYEQRDQARLQKTGVASLDPDGKVTLFEEKPEGPKSFYAVPCLYILTPESLAMIELYLKEGNDPDAPGHFIAWLHTKRPIHAFCFDTPLHSIGDADSYERTKRALE